MLDVTAAVVQVRATPDAARSIRRSLALTTEALERGARLVGLPENYAGIAPAGAPAVHVAAESTLEDDPAVAPFLELADRFEATVILGGLPIRADARRHHNACLVLERGAIRARYDKIHCFEATMPDGALLSELDATVPGDRPVACRSRFGVLGLSICYDLRFPEHYRCLVDAGAEVLLTPSAFTQPTGADHWSVLNRARALESQCYLLAPAQWGVHAAGRQSWGHAMIIDPWGLVIAQASQGEGVAMARLDPSRLQEVRAALPALEHRRLRRETSASVLPLPEGDDGR